MYLKSKGNMNISIPISITETKKIVREFKVVGYCDAGSDNLIEEEGSLSGYTYIFLSQNFVEYNNVVNQSVNARMLIYSQEPNILNEYTQNLGLNIFSVYNYKIEAIQSMKSSIKNKMILCIILYVVLGINLYSSFKNTLSERKYEIGVKRAIGASKYDIIQQFFFEGLIVTIGNIVLSVCLSVGILLMYKMYIEFESYSVWVVYISKYSVAMFLITSIFLSVLYSVIFAYSTTKIEVLENLRGE